MTLNALSLTGENRGQIGSDYAALLVRRFLTTVVAAAFFPSAAFAQDISHGTFFYFGLSNDFFAVAIDSRATLKGRTNDVYDDRVCKIAPLSKNALFFAAGIEKGLYSTGKVVLDVRAVAKDVYAQYGDTGNFDDLAEKWALRVEAGYRKAPFAAPVLKAAKTQNMFLGSNGVFVGIKSNGDIGASGMSVAYHLDGAPLLTHSLSVFTPPASPGLTHVSSSTLEVLREFANGGQTERAKQLIQDNTKLGTGPDAEAKRDSNIVAAVRDWSGEKTIGGEIAAVILERGKDWRWFHRPEFCPQK